MSVNFFKLTWSTIQLMSFTSHFSFWKLIFCTAHKPSLFKTKPKMSQNIIESIAVNSTIIKLIVWHFANCRLSWHFCVVCSIWKHNEWNLLLITEIIWLYKDVLCWKHEQNNLNAWPFRPQKIPAPRPTTGSSWTFIHTHTHSPRSTFKYTVILCWSAPCWCHLQRDDLP